MLMQNNPAKELRATFFYRRKNTLNIYILINDLCIAILQI